MTRRRIGRVAILLMALIGNVASAAPLTISKSLQTVSDTASNLLPKATPGAEIDYTIRITNPNGILSPVTGVVFTDAVPAGTMLRVADLGLLSSGPIEFIDGNLLGLLGSGLGFSFAGLRNAEDSVDFSSDNGGTWTHQPMADEYGCDSAVTNIRVRLGGAQVAGSSFSIRFRVRVK